MPVAPSGSTAPMRRSTRPCQVTVVVYVEPCPLGGHGHGDQAELDRSAATSMAIKPSLTVFTDALVSLFGQLRHHRDTASTETGRSATGGSPARAHSLPVELRARNPPLERKMMRSAH